MDMTTKSCREFVTVLASNEPAPGGGGASALVAALGTALGNMVGSLTVGKKKYADVEEEINALMKKCDDLQTQLLDQVPADAEGFVPLAKAYGIPKDDPNRDRDPGGGDHHRLPGSDAHHGAVLRVARRHRGVRREGLPPGRFRRGLRRGDRARPRCRQRRSTCSSTPRRSRTARSPRK